MKISTKKLTTNISLFIFLNSKTVKNEIIKIIVKDKFENIQLSKVPRDLYINAHIPGQKTG